MEVPLLGCKLDPVSLNGYAEHREESQSVNRTERQYTVHGKVCKRRGNLVGTKVRERQCTRLVPTCTIYGQDVRMIRICGFYFPCH